MSKEAPTTERVASHTPGPWLLHRDNRRERYDIGVKGQFALRLVAEVSFGFFEPAESEQHANARLIAAAPDLLAACRRLRSVINDHVSLADVDALDSAIAKAEGRS